MKQKIVALLTITFLICLLIAPAFAVVNCFQSNDVLNYAADAQNGEEAEHAYGATFVGNDEYLVGAKFYLKNFTAAPTGVIRAYLTLANDSGVPYAGANSTNSLQLSTNSYDTSDLAGYTLVEFVFPGDYLLNSAVTYALVFYNTGAMGQHTYVGRTATGGLVQTANGGASWSSSSYGIVHYFYSNPTVAGGTEDWDNPFSGSTGTTELIDALSAFIIPIVILLLPVILLITITKSTDKWIILIGITIGAALGYFFSLVPLWVVFLVVIGLIGMAYQSVRGGG